MQDLNKLEEKSCKKVKEVVGKMKGEGHNQSQRDLFIPPVLKQVKRLTGKEPDAAIVDRRYKV